MSHHTLETGGVATDASYMARNTEDDYRTCAAALSKFFGGLRLDEIHDGNLAEYQRARAVCDKSVANWERRAGANRIRKEISLLIRVLKAARLWGEEEDHSFRRLRPVEPGVVRALSPSEQHRLLHVASTRLEWRIIHCYIIVALQTTASTDELRALRLGDVFLSQRVINIPSGKNKYRRRTIPLVTDDVKWALEWLIARAGEMGATESWHYLFPIQGSRFHYDATRPMSDSGLKKPWEAVRLAAGMGAGWRGPNSPGLRLYDLRHTGITRMAEAGIAIQTIMSFAGHLTLRMQQHYTAISMAAKSNALAEVWAAPKRVMPVRSAADARRRA